MASDEPVQRASAVAWFTATPDLHARLMAEPPARVADVACRAGEIAFALASFFPLILVDGWDEDDAAIAAARRDALERGVDDRVRFEVRDGADRRPSTRYDLVIAPPTSDDGPGSRLVLDELPAIVAPGGYVIVPEPVAVLAVEEGFERSNAHPSGGMVVLQAPADVNRVTPADR